MRIGRAHVGGQPDFVVASAEDQWVSLASLGVDAADTPAVITASRTIMARLSEGRGRRVPADIKLSCPFVRPGKIIAIGLNYMDHIRETGAAVPERPVVFAKFSNALTGPYDDVVIDPELTAQADYEAELGVVIGRQVRHINEDEAMSCVFGYAIANDVSARDWQKKESFPDRAKGFDTFCPAGPWITTADELADPQALQVLTVVSGEERQRSNTREMIFTVPTLISYLSRTMTLEPGDVILTGTPHGVGLAMSPPRFLSPGDVIRCEIEGLGFIENRVRAPGPPAEG